MPGIGDVRVIASEFTGGITFNNKTARPSGFVVELFEVIGHSLQVNDRVDVLDVHFGGDI